MDRKSEKFQELWAPAGSSYTGFTTSFMTSELELQRNPSRLCQASNYEPQDGR